MMEKDKIYNNYFEMLDIRIKSKNHLLIDYGFVKDALKFHNKIIKTLHCDYNCKKIKKDKKIRTRGGHDLILYTLPDNELNVHMIYYIKTAQKDLNIFIRAHEETHSLHAMKKLSLLEKKLIEINTPIKLNEN